MMTRECARTNLFRPPEQNPVKVALKGSQMLIPTAFLRSVPSVACVSRLCAKAICLAGLLVFSLAAYAQEPAPATPPTTAPVTPPAPAPDAAQTPAPAPDSTQQPAGAPAPQSQPAEQPATVPETPQTATLPPAKAVPPQEPGITEEELKQMLVGKPLYLRGGYLDNSLSFSEHGALIGHSPQGSYTLSAIQIDRVHLTKHKVELEGARYGLHFLGALPYEDPTRALDRVKITPKKKVVKITIDRELVVTPKKKKENEKGKDLKAKPVAPALAPKPPATATPSNAAAPLTATDSATASPATPQAPQPAPPVSPAATPAEQTAAVPTAPAPQAAPAPPAPKEMSAEDEAKAEMAAAPPEERPADPSSVTTTISPAKVLKDALDKIFAQGLDERMMAAMPDFWKLYYQAVAARSDYRPADPNVMRQSTVDKKARLVTNFVPESNEWAQAGGIAGPALYHAVIGADGKPGEIAVARPIGFGLDENAVAAINKATFEPAIKDGKPVPVLLDLYVSFRIYSKRTSVSAKQDTEEKTAAPQLPGPYTVRQQQQPQ